MFFLFFQYLVRPSHLNYDDIKPLNVKVKPNQKEVSNFYSLMFVCVFLSYILSTKEMLPLFYNSSYI